jgi:hypothetical protein
MGRWLALRGYLEGADCPFSGRRRRKVVARRSRGEKEKSDEKILGKSRPLGASPADGCSQECSSREQPAGGFQWPIISIDAPGSEII